MYQPKQRSINRQEIQHCIVAISVGGGVEALEHPAHCLVIAKDVGEQMRQERVKVLQEMNTHTECYSSSTACVSVLS